MLSAVKLLFMLLGFAPAQTTPPAVAVTPTNYYVELFGGTRYSVNKPMGQCNGTADVSYATALAAAGGATANLNCAWGKLGYVAFDGSFEYTAIWGIKGGDIVHIGLGAFPDGLNSPVAANYDGTSAAGNPFAAALPAIPGGTAQYPTTFIGAGVDKTQVYGTYGAGAIFEASSPYITIQDMELTDHEQCSRNGTAGPFCSTDAATMSNFAANGITTGVNTHDLVLRNLNIHGFSSRGIIGPIGGLVTADHVRIGFNAMAGWDFDDGKGTQSLAGSQVNAAYLTIEGNGCTEEYPIVHPGFPAISCADQNNAGYGDGVGTPGTPLNFTCDHCLIRYNTQDGLDLLHTNGSIIQVTNSTSYGNMGQQWKIGAMKSVLFENNTTVHNCRRMGYPIGGNTTYFKTLSDFCRAAGDGIALNIMDGGTITWQNNSFAGYGATSYDIACGTWTGTTGACTQPTITYRNNLNIGYIDVTNNSQPAAVFYWDTTQGMPANPFVANDHNIFYNMRTQPAGGTYGDPHIADEPIQTTGEDAATFEASLDAIDFHLTAASTNALGQGVAIAGLTTDITGAARSATAPSIGAYEGVTTGTTPPGNGGGTTTTPPPNNGGATTTTPPPATTPTSMTITLPMLTCVPSGTQWVCSVTAP